MNKTLKWDDYFKLAEQYFNANGDLLIPSTYKINDINLGMWINTRRKEWKKGTITKERVIKLEAIGMVWDFNGSKWEDNYKLAKQYYKENGNLLISNRYTVNDVRLGAWTSSQRTLYRKGKLTQQQIDKLEAIGMDWSIHGSAWDNWYGLAKQYFIEHGNLLVPISYEVEDYKLGIWVSGQRKAYNDKKLTQERIYKLEQIGMEWDIYTYTWETYYELAKQYREEHGNLLVSVNYEVGDYKLGTWVNTQRNAYKDGTLSSERIKRLNDIGMEWSVLDASWDKCYGLAKEYFDKNGDLLIPITYVVDDIKLGTWISTQRSSYKNYILSSERIKRLNDIGMEWNALDAIWDKYYALAKVYFVETGNLYVPQKYVVDDIRLGKWISRQRANYNKGTLTDEQIHRLESIGMDWDVNNSAWENNYNMAKKYFDKYGNLLVSKKYEGEGIKLGVWVSEQRSANKKGILSAERIKKLEDIGMVWSNAYSQFQTSFPEQAICYYMKKAFTNTENRYKGFGFELDIYVPEINLGIEYDGYHHRKKKDKDIEKNNKCVDKVTLIRVRDPKCPDLDSTSIDYKLKDLSNKELENKINMIVDFINTNYDSNITHVIDIEKDIQEIYSQYIFCLNKQWNDKYELAKQYHKEHGHLMIPTTYEQDGVKLGQWIATLRKSYKKGTLQNIFIDKLEEIDMYWGKCVPSWEDNFKVAKEYRNKYGVLLSVKGVDEDEIKTVKWIRGQRSAYNKGTLSQDKIDKLDTIGMKWSLKIGL